MRRRTLLKRGIAGALAATAGCLGGRPTTVEVTEVVWGESAHEWSVTVTDAGRVVFDSECSSDDRPLATRQLRPAEYADFVDLVTAVDLDSLAGSYSGDLTVHTERLLRIEVDGRSEEVELDQYARPPQITPILERLEGYYRTFVGGGSPCYPRSPVETTRRSAWRSPGPVVWSPDWNPRRWSD